MAFPKGNPVGAISIAAISGRLGADRREDMARELRREVRKIEASMLGTAGSATAASDEGVEGD